MNTLIAPSPDRKSLAFANAPSLGRKVEEGLRRSGYLALRDLECDVRQGVVSLRGRLPSYYLKQVAQAIAGDVEGVRHVINQVEVTTTAGRPPIGRG